ncbi:MAG: two-component sensor histidine kinase [Treponema sp.]|nr:two-component sensor histidine kinase [Treponema sp.]
MSEFVRKVSQKLSKLSPEQLERVIESMNGENRTLHSTLESLSTGLVIVDGDYRCKKSNKAAERLIPFKKRLSGDKIGEFRLWELVDDEYISAFLRTCATEQKTNVSEEFSLAAGDKTRFITIKILPLVEKQASGEGNAFDTTIAGSVITVEDITERTQQEVMLHRMESLAGLTNLAASVAHEIKNPLGAISIHIQLLQKAVRKSREGDGMLPKEKFMEDYLAVINEEIDNLNKIVVDFLFAVRPLQVNMSLSDPDALIEKFVSFFRPEFQSKGVEIRLSLCKDAPRLLIDEKLFRELVINLAQNALAAIEERFAASGPSAAAGNSPSVPAAAGGDGMPDAGGSLLLESCVKDGKYVLNIADNGVGMDEKTASKIFEPYYTTKATGTGLGLTMVYKIVKEFKGDIDVKSVKNHGTVFTISLPVPQKQTMLLEDKGSRHGQL